MDTVPLPFSLPYAVAFWLSYIWAFCISEWSMIRSSKSMTRTRTEKSQDSLRWINGIATLAQLTAFAVAFLDVAKFPSAMIKPVFYLAIILLILGSVLRRHCFRMLGANFTVDVRVTENQTIIDKGAYAYIRHPGYTAGIVMMTGVGLALGSYLSLFVILIATVFLYIRRIQFEEQALLVTLGEKYLLYANGRKRLIPYIY